MNLKKCLFFTALLLISTSVFAQINTITKENMLSNENLSQFGVEEICPICGYVNCVCDEKTTEIAAKITQSNTTESFISNITTIALLAIAGLALATHKLYKSKLKI
ncbi:hypothetical protein SAMN02983004_00217 [Borreliella japonica]|uniref:Uncharacterized protein n=1 Tax=Borreliella japonica TaxID=34095 RepID=A0A1G4P4U4_BORJA|nr:hypothetical protein [Borreliella japonica]WKC89212.1 hypothetical protein QIA20_03795 [Borreliella japonica]SCW27267.1 hypothetical protein SAMN02983004_00217 [Borreliella japonica]